MLDNDVESSTWKLPLWQREDADKEISVESSIPEFKMFIVVLPSSSG